MEFKDDLYRKRIISLGIVIAMVLTLLFSFSPRIFAEAAGNIQVVRPESTLVTTDSSIPITVKVPLGRSFSILEGQEVKANGVGMGETQPVTVVVNLLQGLHSLKAKLDGDDTYFEQLPPIYIIASSQSFDISNVAGNIQQMNSQGGWSVEDQTRHASSLLRLISAKQIPVPISDFKVISVTETSALFTFSPPFGATSVEVKQSTDGLIWTNASTSKTLNNGSTSVEVHNLFPEQTYYFKISVSGGMHAGDSNIIVLTTLSDFMKFNGTSDNIRIANSTELNPDSITIEAWIKPEQFNWLGGIVSKFQKHSSMDYASYTLRLSGNYPYNQINFVYNNNGYGDYGITSNTKLQAGQWYHVVAVYDKSAHKVSLYINGNLDSWDSTSMPLGQNSTDLRIGVDYAEADQLPRYFKGGIREVRIWNRALSGQDIQDKLTDFTMAPHTPYLVGLWHLGSPPEALGSLGNQQTITVTNIKPNDTLKLYRRNDDNSVILLQTSNVINGLTYQFSSVPLGTGYFVARMINGVESGSSNIVNVRGTSIDQNYGIVNLYPGETISAAELSSLFAPLNLEASVLAGNTQEKVDGSSTFLGTNVDGSLSVVNSVYNDNLDPNKLFDSTSMTIKYNGEVTVASAVYQLRQSGNQSYFAASPSQNILSGNEAVLIKEGSSFYRYDLIETTSQSANTFTVDSMDRKIFYNGNVTVSSLRAGIGPLAAIIDKASATEPIGEQDILVKDSAGQLRIYKVKNSS